MTESIFHKIVTKENSYTQLLCNLMKRDQTFCSTVLALLQGKDAVTSLADVRISTQTRLPNRCGQPDLIIKTNEWYVIVEVKTEAHRSRTQKQELGTTSGYLSHLREQKSKWKKVALVFLVPSNWKFKQRVGSGIKKKQTKKGIEVTQRTWGELLQCLPADEETGSLLSEFRLFLAERFGAIEFDTKEISVMFESDAPVQTVLKLNAVLEGIRKKAGNKLATKMVIEKDECGFFLKKGSRWLLYIGCWQAFRDDGHPYPICFGTEDDAPNVKKAFRSAFRRAYKKEAIQFGKWIMGWVPEEDFKNLDAVEQIWSKLEPIWKAVSRAAG